MRRILLLILSTLLFASPFANAQMSDEAVISYIAEGVQNGASEQTLVSELLSKGVTVSQLKRLKSEYESGKISAPASLGGSTASNSTRPSSNSGRTSAASPTVMQMQRPASYGKGSNNNSNLEDIRVSADSIVTFKTGRAVKIAKKAIYGHEMFDEGVVAFEPNVNAATPSDYILGPGDEVIIDVWGNNETSIRQKISPEGRIMISNIGPVYLNGLTIADAEKRVRKALSKKYADAAGSNPRTDVSLTLGGLRSIQVNVVGEVNKPGAYRLSSFSTVFNALYCARGLKESGSIRDISIVRNGSVVGSADLYKMIFDGDGTQDLKLLEGDVIIVPSYRNLVRVHGKVKRPVYYELLPGESLGKLLEYCGGFTGDAYKEDISVERIAGHERSVLSVKSDDYGTTELLDGDVITVREALSRYSNMLTVNGAVFRPGKYQLCDEISTLSQLVRSAGGLTEEAFTEKAQLVREKEDLSYETVAVNIGAILAGTEADIPLRKNDVLTISNIHQLDLRGNVRITGFVHYPGEFPFCENTTVEDLIMMAGGLMEGASTSKIEISRRVNDPSSNVASHELAEVFTYSLQENFETPEKPFYLQPYDVVSVRRSPAFSEQKLVTVSGAVAFPGVYSMQTDLETVSEIIKRAGGLTDLAQPSGSVLKRNKSAVEKFMRESAINMSSRTGKRDTLRIDNSILSDNYTIALDIEKALSKPGSSFDMVLKEGDEIVIPEKFSTVSIMGEVMCPNTILFVKNQPLSYYVNAAGGYSSKAKKGKVYVIYMNGRASRVKNTKSIEPGCNIVVPAKPDKKPLSVGEIMGIGTTAASISTMVATIMNLIKR